EKTLVKKRKATCVGYADLFNMLCHYSGVPSVSVSGYSKNNYVDLGDTCYLQDHMWNAVFVNGRWSLVDATWDAGYITFTKSSLIGKMMHAVTGKDKRKYKPRFVSAPHKTYMMRDGMFFRVDHFAANPDWALVEPAYPVADFERDSAYFFKRYPEQPPVWVQGYDARQRYTTLEPLDRMIEDAFASHAANPHNGFDVGIASYALAARQWSARSTDAHAHNRKCDSALLLLERAATHHEAAAAMVETEKKFLLANNERKATIFQQNLAATKAATNRNAQEAKRFKKTYANGVKSTKEWHSTNAKRLDAMRDDTYFTSKNARVARTEDSAKYSKEYLTLSDSLVKMLAAYRAAAGEMDTLYRHCAQRLNAHNQVASELLKRHKAILLTRQAFYDDLDWEIIAQRNDFNERKHTADSLLFISDTSIFKTLHKKHGALHRKANLVYQVHKARMQAMKKLRTACVRTPGIDSTYAASFDSLATFIVAADAREAAWKSGAGQLQALSKSTNKSSAKLLKALSEERKTEAVNNRARATYINKRSGSMAKEITAIAGSTAKLKLAVSQARQTQASL
ncbi:MAG TPA: transglutaminase domain-containing protein, partial [Chitinophagales bacterium]|nr:transglutaminase domain-containing protein [Chitinophagales bacterium]